MFRAKSVRWELVIIFRVKSQRRFYWWEIPLIRINHHAASCITFFQISCHITDDPYVLIIFALFRKEWYFKIYTHSKLRMRDWIHFLFYQNLQNPLPTYKLKSHDNRNVGKWWWWFWICDIIYVCWYGNGENKVYVKNFHIEAEGIRPGLVWLLFWNQLWIFRKNFYGLLALRTDLIKAFKTKAFIEEILIV